MATGNPDSCLDLVELQTLEGHQDRVWCLAWSPSGDMLASCSGDKTVRIWARKSSTSHWFCSAVLEDTHHRTVRSCAWSPDGKLLATASFDATTAIWRYQASIRSNGELSDFWEQVATLEGHENEVKCVAWSPCGNLVATCGRDKTVWVWEMLVDRDFECVDVKHGHSQDVKTVAWHPNGEVLVSASYDDTIKLWMNDGDDWICAQTLQGHSSTVWGVAFNPSGTRMASCSDDCTVKVWECTMHGREPAWKVLCTITGYHSRTIYSIDWSKDDIIATGDGEDCIKLFVEQPVGSEYSMGITPSYALRCSKRAHTLDVNCIRWHPVQKDLIASAADDCAIKLWQLVQ